MRVIIAGTRNLQRSSMAIRNIIDNLAARLPRPPTAVLSGCSGIVDILGGYWAIDHGAELWEFPADWGMHGSAAGPIRNQEMVNEADALILVWDGRSRGSADVLRKARAAGLVVCEWRGCGDV